MLPRWALGVGVLVGGVAAFALTASPGQTATNYTLWAGAESMDQSLQLEEFAPKSVTVRTGDTVTWHVGSTEFHTVNFLNGAAGGPFIQVGELGPFLNPLAAFPMGEPTFDGAAMAGSGLLIKDDSFSLTFTKPGTYAYLCLIHPEMKGEIVVRDSGQVPSPEQVTQQARNELASEIAGRGLPLLQKEPQEGTATAGDGDGYIDLMRFMPGDITVQAGETVTWVNQEPTGTPHTVTFLAGADAPDLVIPQPQPDGPPVILLNPAVIAPSGGATFDGTAPANSGMIGNAPDYPTNAYSLTFTAPGTYEYLCLLHAEAGMTGTVTVLP